MPEARALLLLKRLQVQNANAISGPLSWGFPAPTAFTGFAHALQRRLSATMKITFDGVGIICHRFDPQVFEPPGRRTRIFRLTRNPLGKDGMPPAFVEEGRAHMEVSLLLEVSGELGATTRRQQRTACEILQYAQGMRLAGGSILPCFAESGGSDRYEPELWTLPDTLQDRREVFRQMRRRLLPGFALVDREDLLHAHLQALRIERPEATAVDALLDFCRLNIEPSVDPDNPDEASWSVRRAPGWLVPIPVGYRALSKLYAPGEVENARDETMPFRFVESLYSVGEWVGPHRVDDPAQLLWRHEACPEAGIYRCINRFSALTREETTHKESAQCLQTS